MRQCFPTGCGFIKPVKLRVILLIRQTRITCFISFCGIFFVFDEFLPHLYSIWKMNLCLLRDYSIQSIRTYALRPPYWFNCIKMSAFGESFLFLSFGGWTN